MFSLVCSLISCLNSSNNHGPHVSAQEGFGLTYPNPPSTATGMPKLITLCFCSWKYKNILKSQGGSATDLLVHHSLTLGLRAGYDPGMDRMCRMERDWMPCALWTSSAWAPAHVGVRGWGQHLKGWIKSKHRWLWDRAQVSPKRSPHSYQIRNSFLMLPFPPEEGYLSTGLFPLKTKTEDCGSKYPGVKSVIFL